MIKSKYYAIDLMKFISALLVVCIHVGPLLDVDKQANFILVQIISRIAVPFFFVASGFFFFQKVDPSREWNDYENLAYLKKYIGRLLKIYFIWTILYLPFTYILIAGDGITSQEILRVILDSVFVGSYYHLWFLPALIFSCSIAYFLYTKWGLRKTIIVAFILYLIGMLGNVYGSLFENTFLIQTLYKGYMAVFDTTRNGLFFGLIFVMIGAYFAHRRIYIRKIGIALLAILTFILLIIEAFLLKQNGFMQDTTSMYFFLIPCVMAMFYLITKLSLKKRKIYSICRKLSLLIYVIHVMFITIILWIAPQMHSVFVYTLTIILSVCAATLIYWSSQRVPLLKNLY